MILHWFLGEELPRLISDLLLYKQGLTSVLKINSVRKECTQSKHEIPDNVFNTQESSDLWVELVSIAGADPSSVIVPPL